MVEIANSKYLEQSTGRSLWQTASLIVICYYFYYMIIIIIDNWWSLSRKKKPLKLEQLCWALAQNDRLLQESFAP